MAYKYKEVADDLRNKINSGKYAPGELMPDQNQIAADYNTTRITVHKALQLLMVEGMVYSKRGSGTFVRKDYSPEKNSSKFGKVSPIDKPFGATLTNQGKKVTSKVLELSARIPTTKEADQLIIPPTEPVYVIRRVRFVNGEVFAYEHTIMPTSITTLTKEVLEGSIYGHLQEDGLSIEGSHRIISAGAADDEDVKNGIASKVGEPVLVIKQLSYLDDGQPFEISESRFPYKTSELTADITL
ncbi:MAG TPA: GntR family transcriptional regulator [Candidatus Companilactobacillus pullicola]|jgi:Transcriptional regulators|uniref:GntR family transcriptional regulator n=1 Tax=Candidatus Companilactobacillus pullicola TaxID=2838523 RepID=A0A9D2CPR9_9LACO|nr:GntR family transcriptional regulator [Candidatus Companilactobacillus pullicola]